VAPKFFELKRQPGHSPFSSLMALVATSISVLGLIHCLALPLDFLLDGLYEPTMAGLSSSTALSLFLPQDLVDRFDLVDIQP
jgi:hypothetical protein